MKKKTFIQISITLYSLLALLLTIVAAALYVVIEFIRSYNKIADALEWAGFIAAILAIILLAYLIIRLIRNRIVLEINNIYVPAYWGKNINKTQHKIKINYEEIQDIAIIASNKNSLNTAISHFATMPYIVFHCKDGSQNAVNIQFYSKKQVIAIIDEIKVRAAIMGNELQNIKTGTEILSDFLQSQKK